MTLCHCRKDKTGHKHEPHPRWSGEWKVDKKTGKSVQELIAACPARGEEGKGKMYQPKLLKSVSKAQRRMSGRNALDHLAATLNTRGQK